MPEINRRKFLIASAGVGALGLSGAAAVTLTELLVVMTLTGAQLKALLECRYGLLKVVTASCQRPC